MPNNSQSGSGGIPGNSHQRKKELKKFKAMLRILGVSTPEEPIPTIKPEEHGATHTKIGNVISSLGVAVAVVLYLFKQTPIVTGVALAILFGSLVYPFLALVGFWKRKTLARFISALTIIIVIVGGIGWAAWPQGRHLTKQQKEGLGKLADAIPPDIGVLVRFPPNSNESRIYAVEFWNVLREHHVKCGVPIIAGVEQPQPGIHIYVTSLFDPAGRPAEYFSMGMEGLGMHPFWGEQYPWADPKVFVIYVGPKENYD